MKTENIELVDKFLEENPPSKFTKFMYKSFLSRKGWNKYKYSFAIIELILLIVSIILYELGHQNIGNILILIYSSILVLAVGCGFFAIIQNNLRFRKAAKKLNLDFKEIKKYYR